MKKKSRNLVPRAVPAMPALPAKVSTSQNLPSDYPAFLEAIKSRIRAAQVKSVLAANVELIRLYWSIGRDMVAKQARAGWGAKIIDRLATDLRREFPGLGGFSRANIYRMRAFFLAWPDANPIVPRSVGQLGSSFVPPVVGQIPWGHSALLIEKLSDPAERLWYAQAALEHGWSRDLLALQINHRLYHRQGKAVTNFSRTLPPPQSDLAAQILKDPYVFDFLTLAADARERDVEQQLIRHIARFLVELGAGFAYVGRQVRLEVGGDDFALDLLFYHTRLHCYVVIDLKERAFKPEDAGKLNFYLSAVDAQMRQPEDKPSIGLLLCRDKNRLVAEYALRDIRKPIGVAEWKTQLTRALPANLKSSLPSIAEIEAELERGLAPAAGRKPKTRAPRRAKRNAGGKK